MRESHRNPNQNYSNRNPLHFIEGNIIRPLEATAKKLGVWAMPVIHDTRSGLRINAKCQVVDLNGEVIPGLYCGGESAGGFSLHGLARCAVQGRIAGRNAAAETVKG